MNSFNNNVVIKIIDKSSQRVFWSMVVMIALLSVTYMVIVHKAVRHAMVREEAETAIVELNSKIGDAEFEYISAKSKITMDTARSMGFLSASTETAFVTHGGVAQAVASR
jgi:hypothetical protein